MNPNLLSIQEIFEILQTAIISPELRDPLVAGGSDGTRTSIFKITPKNGLILVWGDSYTGFTHFNERHSLSSDKYYWSENGKLDNPSKFRKGIIPFGDYPKIADQLFLPENLNTRKNKSPDLFEMYSGTIEDYLGKSIYHMLLYRNTKIIHTMYPQSKVNNPKRYINYRRGKAEGNLWLNPCRSAIGVPYRDIEGKVIYSFDVRKDFETMTETWVLINHILKKEIKVHEKKIEKVIEFNEDLEMLNYANLSNIEKFIGKLDKKK